jgi:hypothetical protein
MSVIFGMRGTGDWATNERPQGWRQGIFKYRPNGTAILTNILSMIKSNNPGDPHFHWWTKGMQSFQMSLTADASIFTDSALTTAYTNGGVVGDVLYIKCSAANVALFRVGNIGIVRKSNIYLEADTRVRITARTEAGASSYLTVILQEIDTNGAAYSLYMSDALIFLSYTNSYAEGDDRPTGIAQNPIEMENYTQIFRTPYELTGTALAVDNLRTGRNGIKDDKLDAMLQHSVEQEYAYIHGIPTSVIGANGKPQRTTGGINHFIKAQGNYANYATDADVASSATWLAGGEAFLNAVMETYFLYQKDGGQGDKLGVCGNGAFAAISYLAKDSSTYNIGPDTYVYGMKINTLRTPFGDINLKIHPLYNLDVSTRNSMTILEPEVLEDKVLRPTIKRSLEDGSDAQKEEWLTESGLQYNLPMTGYVIDGLGLTHI